MYSVLSHNTRTSNLLLQLHARAFSKNADVIASCVQGFRRRTPEPSLPCPTPCPPHDLRGRAKHTMRLAPFLGLATLLQPARRAGRQTARRADAQVSTAMAPASSMAENRAAVRRPGHTAHAPVLLAAVIPHGNTAEPYIHASATMQKNYLCINYMPFPPVGCCVHPPGDHFRGRKRVRVLAPSSPSSLAWTGFLDPAPSLAGERFPTMRGPSIPRNSSRTHMCTLCRSRPPGFSVRPASPPGCVPEDRPTDSQIGRAHV